MSQIVSEAGSRPHLFFLWNAVAEGERDLNGRQYLIFELSTILNGRKLVADLGAFTAQNDADDVTLGRFNQFMREKHAESLYTFGDWRKPLPRAEKVGLFKPDELSLEREVVLLENFQRELHGEPYRFNEHFMQPPTYWYYLRKLWKTNEDLFQAQAAILIQGAVVEGESKLQRAVLGAMRQGSGSKGATRRRAIEFDRVRN